MNEEDRFEKLNKIINFEFEREQEKKHENCLKYENILSNFDDDNMNSLNNSKFLFVTNNNDGEKMKFLKNPRYPEFDEINLMKSKDNLRLSISIHQLIIKIKNKVN
jgi:hypothetical protein